MSSIVKEGKHYKISFYWNDRKYRRSLKVSSKVKAKELQLEYDQLLAKGIFPDVEFKKQEIEIKTLQQLKDEFLNFLYKRTKEYSDKTIKAYEFNLNKLMEIAGDIEMERFTKSMIEKDLLPYLYSKYSKSTVIHFITHFRAIFGKAVDWNVIQKNPFSKMVPRADKKKPRYFKRAEIEKFEEYFTQDDIPIWQYDLVCFGVNTGFRKFELYNLTWINVDLKNQLMRVPGKGNKERIVPLNEQAMKILENREINIRKVFNEVNNIDSIGSAWQRI
jgi:integrase/recombinase XerC